MLQRGSSGRASRSFPVSQWGSSRLSRQAFSSRCHCHTALCAMVIHPVPSLMGFRQCLQVQVIRVEVVMGCEPFGHEKRDHRCWWSLHHLYRTVGDGLCGEFDNVHAFLTFAVVSWVE